MHPASIDGLLKHLPKSNQAVFPNKNCNLQNTICLPFSRPGGGRKRRGEERGSEELGWQPGAVRRRVKTGRHQQSEEEIQHGRHWGLHGLSCSNATLESERKREKIS